MGLSQSPDLIKPASNKPKEKRIAPEAFECWGSKQSFKHSKTKKDRTIIFGGTIIDLKTKDAIPFAMISCQIGASSYHTYSDLDGNYELKTLNPERRIILKIRHIGYQFTTKKVKIHKQKIHYSKNIALKVRVFICH